MTNNDGTDDQSGIVEDSVATMLKEMLTTCCIGGLALIQHVCDVLKCALFEQQSVGNDLEHFLRTCRTFVEYSKDYVIESNGVTQIHRRQLTATFVWATQFFAPFHCLNFILFHVLQCITLIDPEKLHSIQQNLNLIHITWRQDLKIDAIPWCRAPFGNIQHR